MTINWTEIRSLNNEEIGYMIKKEIVLKVLRDNKGWMDEDEMWAEVERIQGDHDIIDKAVQILLKEGKVEVR